MNSSPTAIYDCIKQIKQSLSSHNNLKLLKDYIHLLMLVGLELGGRYDYTHNRMKMKEKIDLHQSIERIKYELTDMYKQGIYDEFKYSTTTFIDAFSNLLVDDDELADLNNRILPNVTHLVMKNPQGFNYDQRCTKYDVFSTYIMGERYSNTYSVYKDSGITIYDLINSMWAVKSSKVDTNYEMYCGCKIKIVGCVLRVELKFDHGS